MEENKKGLYFKICRWLSIEFVTLAGAGISFLLMLPVFYLSFVNRASGDDYGYSVYTRPAWLASHSLAELFRASLQTIQRVYYGWQGTWFSVFCFSLQPEVFDRHAYVVVTFLSFFMLAGSTFYLFKRVFFDELSFDKWSSFLVGMVYLMLMIEYIPGTKSALFWYNGVVHYMLPFVMCQLLCAWLILYVKTNQKKYLVTTGIIMTLLGGSNYQAALFSLVVVAYAMLYIYLSKEKGRGRKAGRLIIPVLFELAGLIISMKAPGNRVRGGEEFGFSASKGIAAIGLSFVYGIEDIIQYMKETPVVWIGFLVLFLILVEAFLRQKKQRDLKYPIWTCIGLYCLYSAMQTPAIYANVEVSLGVYNMNYQVFLILMVGVLTAAADKAAGKIRMKKHGETAAGWTYRTIVMPGFILCILLLWVCKGNLKQTTTYKSLIYITSGQASDYKEQMDLQTDLLLDETVSDVIVPFINDEQGPLMHMPITADPEAWTNTVTREFYRKESLRAIPREEWLELYGKEVAR